MPANFTQILDREFREYEHSKTDSPRRKNRDRKQSKNRLNESDDESHPTVFKNRICALLTKTNGKNTIVPQNMVEMMRAEEARLLSHVSENVKMKFMEKRQAIEAVSKTGISFDQVAGYDDHIMSLKEMIGLPLMYPDVFSQFQISPPKGVLFYGPPGTGKTMMARALASSCSSHGKPVAFFMRKGADVLNKWVGESEKQLRLLFEQAKAWQPSIIFFDEIDGLAPVRSSKQDQIHASIVSTLLALMDGLDDRGQVVVIGATNRIESIDPALRRPGRFDREFFFGLPKQDARKKIIQQATKRWNPVIPENEIEKLACMTHYAPKLL
jgi:SpoVK/Ycf46/Vps4 family AAA+-type ATPase